MRNTIGVDNIIILNTTGNLTMGENVRYLMHKCDIVNNDWSQNINILYGNVELYSKDIYQLDNFNNISGIFNGIVTALCIQLWIDFWIPNTNKLGS